MRSVTFRGIGATYKYITVNEGFRALWRGNIPQVIRCLHMQEINLLFKDRIMRQFKLTEDMSSWKKLQVNILSGGLSGVLTDCFLYSFDMARTQMAVDMLNKDGKRQYKAFFEVYQKLLKSEGFRGLYRGFTVSATGVFIYRGCYFGLFDTLRPMVLPVDAGFGETFILAYAVTMVSMQFVYPFDTLRRRMMLTAGSGRVYPSSLLLLKMIVKSEGVRSLYRGSVANIFRGTTGALVLAVFDRLKHRYLEWKATK